MSVTELMALAAAAAAAGVINAIAGGGTLITFPVLMLFGTSPLIANATSTVALTIGTAGSIFGYREQVATVKPWLRRFVLVSIAGGWCGSLLLTRTNDAVFARLVPFLILFATVLFFAQGAFRRFAVRDENDAGGPSALPGWFSGAVVFQFVVAIYGGYFGAGIGILMLASLGLIGLTNIHQMNALKTVLGSLINFVAAAWFTISGLIDWPRAGVMTAGALVGYYFGARYSQRFSQQRVRQMITAIGLVISAVMFYRQFR